MDYFGSDPPGGREKEKLLSEENKAVIRRLYEVVCNQHDPEAADELVAPDVFNPRASLGARASTSYRTSRLIFARRIGLLGSPAVASPGSYLLITASRTSRSFGPCRWSSRRRSLPSATMRLCLCGLQGASLARDRVIERMVAECGVYRDVGGAHCAEA